MEISSLHIGAHDTPIFLIVRLTSQTRKTSSALWVIRLAAFINWVFRQTVVEAKQACI